MPSYNQNLVFQGLGTISVQVPDAGIYSVDGKITLPTITTAGVQSALVVTINKNGSPVYVGSPSARGFFSKVSCAANDTIAVVFSSASAVDAALNVIKSNISISLGV